MEQLKRLINGKTFYIKKERVIGCWIWYRFGSLVIDSKTKQTMTMVTKSEMMMRKDEQMRMWANVPEKEDGVSMVELMESMKELMMSKNEQMTMLLNAPEDMEQAVLMTELTASMNHLMMRNYEQIMMHVTEPQQMEYINQIMMSLEDLQDYAGNRLAEAERLAAEERCNAALKREQVHKVLYTIENGIVGKYTELVVKTELSEENKSGLMTDYVLGFCRLDMSDELRYVRWAVDVDANEGKLSWENWNTLGYLHIETMLHNVLKAVWEARAALF